MRSQAPTPLVKKSEPTDIFADPLIEDINLNDDDDDHVRNSQAGAAVNESPLANGLQSKPQPQLSFLPESSSPPPLADMSSPFSEPSFTPSMPQPAATYPTTAPASIATTNILGSPITPPLNTSYSTNSFQSQNSVQDNQVIPPSVSSVITGRNAASIAASTGGQFIEVEVSEPRKCGDGMGSYILYKVTTRTNLRFFRKDLISVDRRFSDFLGLRDKLAEKHLHLGRIVPPAPEKDAYNTAKVKMAKDEGSGDDFTEKRAAALQRFLNRVSAHPDLLPDPDFREFLELDSVLPRAKNTSALSGAGMKRLLTRVGETVNKITFKMDESDPVRIALFVLFVLVSDLFPRQTTNTLFRFTPRSS
jgi:hypothetical protein